MAWALAGQSSERRSAGESEGGWDAGFEGIFENFFGQSRDTLARPQREQLAKLLGMLSSNHEGERRNAVALLERQRKDLGLSWEEIIMDRKR